MDEDKFSRLPNDCISHIISLTSPGDADRSSAVSRGFNSASEADPVWESFLPQDYQQIISNSVTPLNYASQKNLFTHLLSGILLNVPNGGTLSFWLTQSSRKKCYMLCARELSIAWSDDWNWTSVFESRFSEVAELMGLRSLDIQGRMQTKMLSRDTYYAAYLVFKIPDNSYGLDHFMKSSVKFTNSASGDECDSVFLTRTRRSPRFRGRRWRQVVEHTRGQLPEERNDGWMEIYLGKFFNNEGDNEVEMRLYETRILHRKKGLIIEGIELRPMEDS